MEHAVGPDTHQDILLVAQFSEPHKCTLLVPFSSMGACSFIGDAVRCGVKPSSRHTAVEKGHMHDSGMQ